MVIDKVLKYISDNNMNVSAFEKKCGLGNGTVSGWKSGNPRIETLMKVVSATGIPLGDWLQE